MLRVLNCLAVEHDIGLVLLAGAVCVTACMAFMRVYASIRLTDSGVRRMLFVIAALIAGAGIWTTHFVAMLAYDPGLPTGYEPIVTGLSLAIAILFSAVALRAAMVATPGAGLIAGIIFGLGTGAMHYVGMSAFETEGYIVWDGTLVVASILIGAAMSAAAMFIARKTLTPRRQVGAALMLTLAICSLHFTGMGAAVIVPSPLETVEPQAMSHRVLSFGVAGIAILIIMGGLAATVLETVARGAANARMRRLANAAHEGLVVLRGRQITDANAAFLAYAGASLREMEGKAIDPMLRIDAGSDDGARAEGLLMPLDGSAPIPVEILRRSLDHARADGEPLTVLALRDLRERRSAEERIRYLAEHDSLTGLPNRHALTVRLQTALERAVASREPLAVLCIDLDHFKEANDIHGHAAGDRLLVETARRIEGSLAAPSFAARLGGDEFVVVLIGGADAAASAMTLAADLIDTLRQPVAYHGHDLVAGCSIGVALLGEDGENLKTLMANADMALYRAKEDGRGTFRFFKRDMDERIRDRRALARDLREAITSDALSVFYQPQVRTSDNAVCGFEALVRWRHPTRGMVTPDQFIPLAEECGLIGPLGEWVLRQACRDAAAWEKPLSIAVNLSPLQLHQRSLPQMVHTVLLETGLAASRLELEVTETALFKDYQRALDTLRGLKALGVRVAMDDFGTGFSSLATLQSFPFDKIKIDKSFVEKINRHERANVIVRAVLGIGRSLDIPVVAEGVETEEQIAFLRGESCAELQGFAFGRPAPLADTRAVIAAGTGKAAA